MSAPFNSPLRNPLHNPLRNALASRFRTFTNQYSQSLLALYGLDPDLGNNHEAVVETGETVYDPVLETYDTQDVTYPKPAVRINRDSDGISKTLTLAEVANGTLLDWVTELSGTANGYVSDLYDLSGSGQVVSDVTPTGIAQNNGGSPYEVFTGASTSGFTGENTLGVGVAGWELPASYNNLKVTFDLTLNLGTCSIQARSSSIFGSVLISEQITGGGSKSFTLSALGIKGLTFGTDVPSDFVISNLVIQEIKPAYDAVQATAANQPKIVDAGVLNLDALSNASKSFDGVNDDLTITAIGASASAASVYAITDNAGLVSLDTLTAQDLSAVTSFETILATLTWDELTALAIYSANTNEAAIQASLNKIYGT